MIEIILISYKLCASLGIVFIFIFLQKNKKTKKQKNKKTKKQKKGSLPPRYTVVWTKCNL
jgi:flagellar basal body-associated protein FliL